MSEQKAENNLRKFKFQVWYRQKFDEKEYLLIEVEAEDVEKAHDLALKVKRTAFCAVLYFEYPLAKDGYKCPNCQEPFNDNSFREKTESKFCTKLDPHYAWEEHHICTKCSTDYVIKNCT